jgi:ribokinase/sulfofructose kinase
LISNLFSAQRVMTVFESARRAGTLTVLDLEWPEVQRYGWEASRQAVAQADLVSVNRQVVRGFAAIAGLAEQDAVPALLEALQPAGQRVCITLAEDGVIAREGARVFSVAAEKVVPVNTNGAGDRFLAACVNAIMLGNRFDVSVRYGTSGAALLLSGVAHGWKDIEALIARSSCTGSDF